MTPAPRLRATITALRSALENYGDHHEWCATYPNVHWQTPYRPEDCTCGLRGFLDPDWLAWPTDSEEAPSHE